MLRHPDLKPGLYLVATPIGTAGDITLRALDILTRADVIAAEDTRQTRHLLEIHGIAAGRRLRSYHDHSPPARREDLLAEIRDGRTVALVSDAGTPLLADPGYKLVQAALAEGLAVTTAPGPSSLLAALSLAGLPTDRFFFAGFLPPKGAARRRALAELKSHRATLVFLENPARTAAALADMVDLFGERPAALCRELTKRFEEVRREPLSLLARSVADMPPKGEVVLVVGGAPEQPAEPDLDALIRALLPSTPVNLLAKQLSDTTAIPRKLIYQRALELRHDPLTPRPSKFRSGR
jgi:16S rRNA (cytidine1402-2'-O)-methyltransferase